MMEEPAGYDVTTYEKGWRWWFGFIRFVIIHALCLVAFWVGFDWVDIAICVALYYVRIFFVTAGYHRYFSHRTYKMGRVMQFLMAFGAMTTAQKGVLWWASHHRHHHKHSDTPNDVHSVRQGGFWWAHMGWIFHPRWEKTEMSRVRDLARYPELMWLERNKFVPPLLLALGCFLLGGWTGITVWFLWSTVLCWHGTFTINSLAHVYGSRRYDTTDDSKNNFWLALLTMGEGWHNNHHHYQASVNQGWFWWEIDLTYYVLLGMEKLGLVRDLRRPPEHVVHDRKHPVQQAIQSFRESAATVKADALNSIQELSDSMVRSYEETSARWGKAKADAHASWEQRKKDFDTSVDGITDRWDVMLEEWSMQWEEQVDEIMERTERRFEELQDSVLEADKKARRAVGDLQDSATAYMEEIREAANRAAANLEDEIEGLETADVNA